MCNAPSREKVEGFVVAIDGPAGSGKSTAARRLAETERLAYLNTGAMYRAVALLADEGGFDLERQPEKVEEIARDLAFEYRPQPDGDVRFFVKNMDRTDALFTSVLTGKLRPVVNNERVRAALVAQMRKAAYGVLDGGARGVVMEGRDIGTVVFPDADVKIYLSADLDARAKRRAAELEARGEKVNLDGLKNQIRMRDDFDSSRSVGPLRKAADAIELDTTSLDADAVLENIRHVLRERF
jgi:cytidylate kinase